MNKSALSTILNLHAPTAMILSCSLMAACSAKQNTGKSNGWFNWNNDESITESYEQNTQSVDQTPESNTTGSAPAVIIPATSNRPVEQAKTQTSEPTASTPDVVSQDSSSVEEIVQLYRRLHVEMAQDARSQLIIELLNDSRERVQLLGFELASRDLSSGAQISADAANTAVQLLSSDRPLIRTGAVRLITRLALPDAMTILTSALKVEKDPAVAEAILRGIERWPSDAARLDVLKWYQTTGQARIAAASAAWGIADLELWKDDQEIQQIRDVYRSLDTNSLTDADQKLMAVTGTNEDITRLISIARDSVQAQDNTAIPSSATALIYTPLGVDPLLSLAQQYPALSPAAAQSIENHRLNPAGLKRLAALKWNNESARIESLTQLFSKLDQEQLADAVRLARTDGSIDDALSIRLLNRLVAGSQIPTPRTAPGVILLAQLELTNLRPDRTLEVLSLLPESGLDPVNTLQANQAKATAHIMLAEFEPATQLNTDPQAWMNAFNLVTDPTTKFAIAQQITNQNLELPPEQLAQVQSSLENPPVIPEAITPDQSDPDNTDLDADSTSGSPADPPSDEDSESGPDTPEQP